MITVAGQCGIFSSRMRRLTSLAGDLRSAPQPTHRLAAARRRNRCRSGCIGSAQRDGIFFAAQPFHCRAGKDSGPEGKGFELEALCQASTRGVGGPSAIYRRMGTGGSSGSWRKPPVPLSMIRPSLMMVEISLGPGRLDRMAVYPPPPIDSRFRAKVSLGPGCVKTQAFNLRVENPSRFRQFKDE